MKKLIVLLFFIPLLTIAQINDKEKLIGKWIGMDKSMEVTLSFDKEGFAYFELQDQILGGKEFIYDGKKDQCSIKLIQPKSLLKWI